MGKMERGRTRRFVGTAKRKKNGERGRATTLGAWALAFGVGSVAFAAAPGDGGGGGAGGGGKGQDATSAVANVASSTPETATCAP
ncbi:MAG: hypothetical protein IKK39_07630, partial [Thermoguttaceae bacterium]|nr:hypothetical protein [Thermoguttaceae bacterium]